MTTTNVAKPPIICLMGPTASGKTAIALELVKHFPFEIISVDSAMVYRGMDIGTAKPDHAMQQKIPHHLIDIRDPTEPYSAAQFRSDALAKITEILARGKLPLLVGGTMLYFKTLQQGLAPLPEANAAVRALLERQGKQEGWPTLHQQLSRVDPESARRIHPHDSQRIQRALEVFTVTGKTLTAWHAEEIGPEQQYRFINIALNPPTREILHQRIAERFHDMLQVGFVAEVQSLYTRGDLSLDTPAIRSVGYRQVWQYLAGQLTYDEMIAKGIAATRQLAKRQLTWLRSWPEVVWFDSELPDLYQKVDDFVRSQVLSPLS